MSIKAILISLSLVGMTCAPISPAFADGNEKSDLAYNVHNFSKSWWQSICVEKLMTFNLPTAGWTKMKAEGGIGVDTTLRCAQYMAEFCKRFGMEEPERVESNHNDRDANKPKVEALIEQMKERVSFTLEAPSLKFNDTEWDLTHRYMLTIVSMYKDSRFKPKGDAAFITQVMSTTAKDIAVSCTPDGKHFTITCPADKEPSAWDDKIIKGMLRYSK